MDLQTVRSQELGHWTWARTGALILFVVTGILLVVSLRAENTPQNPAAFASSLAGMHGKTG